MDTFEEEEDFGKKKELESLIFEEMGITREKLAKTIVNNLDKINSADLIQLLKNLGKKELTKLYDANPELAKELLNSDETEKLGSSDFENLITQYFGYFKIIKEFKGGMGKVYISKFDENAAKSVLKNMDCELETRLKYLKNFYLDKQVAVKVLLDAGNKKTRERFEREILVVESLDESLLADVDKPKKGVIPILESGTMNSDAIEEGLTYYVMPVCFPLDKKDISIDDAVTLVYNSAQVLAKIHEHGIVHRDIKPDNILLAKEKDYRYPVIADFGLVKDVLESVDSLQTASKAIMGTPQYMSPEQAGRKLSRLMIALNEKIELKSELLSKFVKDAPSDKDIAKEKDKNKRIELRKKRNKAYKKAEEELNPDDSKNLKEFNNEIQCLLKKVCKTDQYSLAAVLYELTTGLKPDYMESEKDIAQEETQDAMKKIFNLVDSDTELKVLPQEKGVSDGLSAVILKAMEKNPDNRYEDMNEFVNELEKVMNNKVPSVLEQEPDYLEKRMFRKTGADYFFEQKKYSFGRQILEENLEKAEKELKQKPHSKELLSKARKWKTALKNYEQKEYARLEYLRDAISEGDFEKPKIQEFLELLFEYKIRYVEEELGDLFPGTTLPDGKWRTNEGKNAEAGYHADIIRIGSELNPEDSFWKERLESRIDTLKDCVTDTYLPGKGIKTLLAFLKKYNKNPDKELEKLIIKEAEAFNSVYKKLGFITSMDISTKEFVNGYCVGMDSLLTIDLLFEANKLVSHNNFFETAIGHIDWAIENLYDNGNISRFVIADENRNIKRKCKDTIRHYLAENGKLEIPKDEPNFDKNKDYIHTTSLAYLFKGLIDTYKHTKIEKYKEKADKVLDLFWKEFEKNNIIPFAFNDKDTGDINNCLPYSIFADTLLIRSKLTDNEKEKKKFKSKSRELLQYLVKIKQDKKIPSLDLTRDYKGLITNFNASTVKKDVPRDCSSISADRYFISALSRLVENEIYNPRVFKAIESDTWEDAYYQSGFTNQNNALDKKYKTGLRIRKQKNKLKIQIECHDKNTKANTIDIILGNKTTTYKLDSHIKEIELDLPAEKEIPFNIIRNTPEGILSWSYNKADLHAHDNNPYVTTKQVLVPSKGKLIFN